MISQGSFLSATLEIEEQNNGRNKEKSSDTISTQITTSEMNPQLDLKQPSSSNQGEEVILIEDIEDTHNELNELQLSTIEKPFESKKEFFLIGEMFIEFNNLDEDSSFLQFKEIQRKFHPISSVEIDKLRKFVRVQLNQTYHGIKDFSFIIKQLESLQNKDYFSLAQGLKLFANQIEFLQDPQDLQIRQLYSPQNTLTFQQFQKEAVSTILSSLDKKGFYSYSLFQCVDDMSDAICVEYGLSERFVRLLGQEPESYIQLLLRQGWFDPTMFANRNKATMEYIQFINSFMSSYFDESTPFAPSNEMTIITFDGIKMNVFGRPNIHYCFSEQYLGPYSSSSKLVLGFLYVIRIHVDEAASNSLIRARNCNEKNNLMKNSFSKQKKASTDISSKKIDLGYSNPSDSYQHFEYRNDSYDFLKFIEKHTPQINVTETQANQPSKPQ